MAISRDEIFRAALDLSIFDRHELACMLYESLPDEQAIEEAIAVETHRRWLEYKRGEAEAISGEDSLKDLQVRLDRAIHASSEDELLPEYSLQGAVRGKYADLYSRDATVVLLDPDVAEVFPDAESVNRALRALAQIIREQTEKSAA
jgi:putative addiction module component (TIGR02574 family)